MPLVVCINKQLHTETVDSAFSVTNQRLLLQITNLFKERFLGLLITPDQLLHHHHLACGFMSHLRQKEHMNYMKFTKLAQWQE